MSKVFYYLVLKPLSFLPLNVLYLFSDFLFVMIYHVTGYRKAVVNQNIRNSFPEKSPKEIEEIQKAFFRHLCDLITESIKLFSISLDELRARFIISNPEIFDKYYKQKQSIILVGGHYNNWEIAAVSLKLWAPHQTIGIYSPLSNKFFNKKMAQSRTRYGVQIITKAEVRNSFVENKDKLTMTVFGADQSPTYSKKVYWTNFLNQETAVHIGTELFALKYNYPVLFIKVNKVKRGYYQAEIEELTSAPKTCNTGEITALHTQCLEKMIIENPQYWLWSHKRWKRKMTDGEREAEAKATAA